MVENYSGYKTGQASKNQLYPGSGQKNTKFVTTLFDDSPSLPPSLHLVSGGHELEK